MVKILKLKNLLFAAAAVILVAVLSVSAYYTNAYAVYFGKTPRLVPIYSVETEEKKVSISFDCAWGVEHTDEILNALRVGNVKATWFMVEFWAEKYPDYVKKIDGAGHEIGTHSSTHSYMSKQNSEEIKLELSSSSEAIKSVTGKDVNLFRPPYGDYDDELIKTASEQGYYSIQWDCDSGLERSFRIGHCNESHQFRQKRFDNFNAQQRTAYRGGGAHNSGNAEKQGIHVRSYRRTYL